MANNLTVKVRYGGL